VISHKQVPKFLDTGVVMVTKQNIDTPEAKNVYCTRPGSA
jgi:ribose transport system substrate-binding protein